MKRELKPLTSFGKLIANRRSPIHKPTQGHKSKTDYSRRDKWSNRYE